MKWALIGRWKPQQIRVWSLSYVRFWVVKMLIRSDPLVLFVGSPLYTLYLRALGAKIGRDVAVFSRNLPVCTDLLTIGDGTVIRKDSFFSCYRAHAGLIQTGAVVLGKDVVISEATVLDIGTSLGDGAQLGHASALHSGQAVPDGEHWHGSPAQRADVDYRAVGPAGCGAWRRTTHSALQLLAVLLVYVPLAVGGVGILLAEAPQLTAVLQPGPTALTDWMFYVRALAASLLFFAAVPFGLLFQATVPRLLSRTITPGKVYPLYGFHYGVHRIIALTTNRKFLTRLFGDSSGIVHYLRRCLGYDLSRVEQTGSNFGTDLKHETPYLSSVGTGTMVADGLSIVNADFSNTSFRVSRASIGPRNYLGNKITYPSRGRTGDNCLLATKVMVPVDGKMREGVGLLGSPSFEIPRSVQRDSTFDELKSGDQLGRRLTAKNRHNVATMALYLLVRWLYFLWVTLLVAVAAELYDTLGAWAIALGNVLVVLSAAVFFVLVDRVVTALHPLTPLFCRSTICASGGENASGRCPRIVPADLQRHPLQERDLAPAGGPDRQEGLRRRLLPDRAVDGHHRRRLHSEHGKRRPVPLAGGRHLQVRPQHDRLGLHTRRRRLRPLRRGDGRRRGSRARLLPHEGRSRPATRAMGRKSGPGDRWPGRRRGLEVGDDESIHGSQRRVRARRSDRGRVRQDPPVDPPRYRAPPSTGRPSGSPSGDAASAGRPAGGAAESGAAGRARQGARRAVRRPRGHDRLPRRAGRHAAALPPTTASGSWRALVLDAHRAAAELPVRREPVVGPDRSRAGPRSPPRPYSTSSVRAAVRWATRCCGWTSPATAVKVCCACGTGPTCSTRTARPGSPATTARRSH